MTYLASGDSKRYGREGASGVSEVGSPSGSAQNSVQSGTSFRNRLRSYSSRASIFEAFSHEKYLEKLASLKESTEVSINLIRI